MWRRNVQSPQQKCAICALAVVCRLDGCLSPLLCLFPGSLSVLNSDLASLNTNPPAEGCVYPRSESKPLKADPPSLCTFVHSSLTSSSHPGVELCTTAAWESF